MLIQCKIHIRVLYTFVIFFIFLWKREAHDYNNTLLQGPPGEQGEPGIPGGTGKTVCSLSHTFVHVRWVILYCDVQNVHH